MPCPRSSLDQYGDTMGQIICRTFFLLLAAHTFRQEPKQDGVTPVSTGDDALGAELDMR